MTHAKRLFLVVAIFMFSVAAVCIARDAYAGHKCPNRYFKKIKATGVGDSEDNAKKAYMEDVGKQADKVKGDCTDCECEEEGEKCTFKYTYLKKPKCTPKAPGFKCVGFIRPGCFCMDPDEDFLTTSDAKPSGSGEKKE